MSTFKPDFKGLSGGRAGPPFLGFILAFSEEALTTTGVPREQGSLSSQARDQPLQLPLLPFPQGVNDG